MPFLLLNYICATQSGQLIYIFFGGLECFGHSFAYNADFIFDRCLDSNPKSCCINLATHLPIWATYLLGTENVEWIQQ